MNRLLLISLLFFMSSQTASAQWFAVRSHSSTAQEGVLRGRGRAAIGQGVYLNNLGDYKIKQQDAYRAQLENESFRIRTQRELEAERARIHKQKNPDYFTREMTRLDSQEDKLVVEARKHSLKIQEAEMRANGKLPPKPKYTYKGVTYESYAVFKRSRAYQQKQYEYEKMRQVRQMREAAEKAAKEKELQEAVEWLRDWNSKSSSERTRITAKKIRDQKVRKVMSEYYYEKFMKKN